jgi:Txe/YoeB family toxin of Txe-Axe toxin-antitoxin module
MPAIDPDLHLLRSPAIAERLLRRSRHITDEHRLVYQLRDEELIIVQARYRY